MDRPPPIGRAGVVAGVSVAVVAASALLLALLWGIAGAASPARDGRHRLTTSQLSADLRAGALITRAPPHLTPPLAAAAGSLPAIVTNGCHLQHAADRRIPCIYGDTRSRISVVLFGDSHAAAWFPALDLISKEQHWRLVVMTKAACPPAEVNILAWWSHTYYSACNRWRWISMAQISVLHPALVIITWARFLAVPEARPLAGVPSGYGSTWQNGLAAILKFLRGAAEHTILISDVPTLLRYAPDCISRHISDVRPCTASRRAATRLADVKAQELELARRLRIDAIDPTSWFCTPAICPVIVRNMIVYRDNSHMVPVWSRFIAPVLAAAIRPVMRRATAGALNGASTNSS